MPTPLAPRPIEPPPTGWSFRRLIAHLYDLGFGVIIDAFNYFLLGAVIVFPIWLVMRIMKTTSRDRHDS